MPLPPASLDTEVEAGGELDQALQRRQWVMGDELVLDVPSQTPQEERLGSIRSWGPWYGSQWRSL